MAHASVTTPPPQSYGAVHGQKSGEAKGPVVHTDHWPFDSNSLTKLRTASVPRGAPVEYRPPTRVLLKRGGGGPRGDPPPPAGDPELLEAPKAPQKFFDWPKAQRKI